MNDLAAEPAFDAHAFFGAMPRPPASELLGWRLESADPEAGEEVAPSDITKLGVIVIG